MAVTTWHRHSMEQLIRKLQRDYPSLTFIEGALPCWSPGDRQVYYAPDAVAGPASLLHELAHALLHHTTYTSDVDLLKKEVAAWERARSLASHYAIELNVDHIQDCLDTYRDWLHKRSSCPVCQTNSIQVTIRQYTCMNCGHTWRVSASRLCRPYRLSGTLEL